jgi:hypothetical protein
MRPIHVFVDNASYHKADIVKEWLAAAGGKIALHFVPSYCPHLDPIERLWGLMHENVTHNQDYKTFAEFRREIPQVPSAHRAQRLETFLRPNHGQFSRDPSCRISASHLVSRRIPSFFIEAQAVSRVKGGECGPIADQCRLSLPLQVPCRRKASVGEMYAQLGADLKQPDRASVLNTHEQLMYRPSFTFRERGNHQIGSV